jgi:hypothetical protein
VAAELPLTTVTAVALPAVSEAIKRPWLRSLSLSKNFNDRLRWIFMQGNNRHSSNSFAVQFGIELFLSCRFLSRSAQIRQIGAPTVTLLQLLARTLLGLPLPRLLIL